MTVSGVRPAKGAGAVASAVRLVRSLISETHCAPLQVSFPTTFCCLEDLSTVSQKAILITGGAGYIGSHVLLQLQERGERVVALDNLYTGFRQAVRDAPLIVARSTRAGVGSRFTLSGCSRHLVVGVRQRHHQAPACTRKYSPPWSETSRAALAVVELSEQYA